MILYWLLFVLERLEAMFALIGRPDLAGQVCHLAVSLGMIGPCQP